MPEEMDMAQNDLLLANYAAAFIDILGQREQLRGCGLLPKNNHQIMELAKNTIGVVSWLRASFEDYYLALMGRSQDTIPSERHQHESQDLKKIGLKFQRFSDGLVVYQSLFGDPRPEVINGLFGLVSTCGCLCLQALIRSTPIRGGVDVAWGTELNDNDLYGCALANAYELESEIAKYPRIVVGENLRQYLIAVNSQLSGTDASNTYTKQLSRDCLDLLGRDSDGTLIIDYLGSGFRNHMTLDAEHYRKAYSYIEAQINHWQASQKETLRQRYEMLRQYFQKNHECWAD